MKLVLVAALAVLAGPALAQSVALQGPDGQAATLSAADLAALTRIVGEIHARIIQRPLTEEEAAGEAELSLESISLELDAVDLADLPAGATEEQSEDWINRYINSGVLLEAEAIDR